LTGSDAAGDSSKVGREVALGLGLGLGLGLRLGEGAGVAN